MTPLQALWARRLLALAAFLQALMAVQVLMDSYDIFGDACKPVPFWLLGMIPVPGVTLPKNLTYCTLATRVVSPGFLVAFAIQFMEGVLQSALGHPVLFGAAGAALAYGLSVNVRKYRRRTFERRHLGKGERAERADSESEEEEEEADPHTVE